jgi:hypothetical protein
VTHADPIGRGLFMLSIARALDLSEIVATILPWQLGLERLWEGDLSR